MIRNAFAIVALFVVLPAAAQTTATVTPAASPCASADRHAFDFWVGEWDVTPYGGGPLVAHSRIESLYSGCAIRENWMPLKGGGGGSLSNFDSGGWHQTWVDSAGARVVFEGRYTGNAMVLTGSWPGVANGKDGLVRMTYTREPNGAVRQKGDVSTDNGATWSPSFDFLYTPAKAP